MACGVITDETKVYKSAVLRVYASFGVLNFFSIETKAVD